MLFFPGLRFQVSHEEVGLFSPSIASAKNVSFDPVSGRLGGVALGDSQAATLGQLMRRFSDSALALLGGLLPRYAPRSSGGAPAFDPRRSRDA